jgi:hypothetical protein
MTQDPTLTLPLPLATWRVTLKSGAVLLVRAHAFAERANATVFLALIEGTPSYELELVSIPSEEVAEVDGG